VNGFVIADEKPKPHATIDIRKPVKESSPKDTVSMAIIGSRVSVSSKSPRNAPLITTRKSDSIIIFSPSEEPSISKGANIPLKIFMPEAFSSRI